MAKERTKIEDYAFLSDTQTGALVSRDGCVDWLCFPRFDSAACFASLSGRDEKRTLAVFPGGGGQSDTSPLSWRLAHSRNGNRNQSGAVRLIDFMPPRGENPDIVRIIEGLRGKVSDADGADHPF